MQRFFKNNTGATVIEYAVIASVVALIVMAAIMMLGKTTGNLYDNTQQQIQSNI